MATREELERQVLLLRAFQQRQATDPLLTWQPHAKQKSFIDAVLGKECYEHWLLAANRAGKSDAGAFCGSTLARYGVEPLHPAVGSHTTVWDRATSGWVVSLDFPASRDLIQPKYFDNGFIPGGASHAPFIPEREIAQNGWNKEASVLKLKNGSLVGFKSADSGRKKFQGVEKDWIHFDEEPPKDVYTECTIRVGGGRRLRVFGTCTLLPPEGQVGGVSWVFPDIVQPWQKGNGVAQVHGASIYDNPHLDQEEIARLEAKYPIGSTERRIRLDGELLPGLSGTRAYGSFVYAMHVAEQPPIEPRRPLCWMLDFNVEPMVSLVGQQTQSFFRIHRELILEEGSVTDMADLFRTYYPSHRAEVWVYGDATGEYRDAQTAKTDYDLVRAALRGYPVPLRFKLPSKNPPVPSRVNAVNRALKDEYGNIRVEIDPSCEELIADLEGVLRDPRGGLKKTYNKKDPYVRRTHTSDALGYWIAFAQPVTSEPIRPQQESQTSRGSRMSIKAPTYGFSRGNPGE